MPNDALWALIDISDRDQDEGVGCYLVGLYRTAQAALTDLRTSQIGDEHYAALWWYPCATDRGRTYQYVGWNPAAQATAYTVEKVDLPDAE